MLLGSAPRLTGIRLCIVAWLMDTPLANLFRDQIYWKFGIAQVLRECKVSEVAAFQPQWPIPGNEDELVRTARLAPGMNKVSERMATACIAAGGKGSNRID